MSLPVPGGQVADPGAGADAELAPRARRRAAGRVRRARPLVVAGRRPEGVRRSHQPGDRSQLDAPVGPDASLVVGAAAGGRGLAGPDHQLAAEVADLLAVLVEALGLDGDDAAVALGRELLVEHAGLGVDGVAVEGRLGVLERLDLEVGDGGAADVGDAHAQHQRVHEVADHQVLAVRRLVLGEPRVGVHRVVVHRDHAEQVVVVLGDRLARPVLVDVADLEVLEVAAERSVVRRHVPDATSAPPATGNLASSVASVGSPRAAPRLVALHRDPRLPAVALASYVALAVPLVIVVLGRHWWFYWDEWGFLSERDVSVDGLFQPHNHSHLTALPVLVYRGLWNVVGARSYRPYQVPVLLLHLGIVSVLYALMRRSGCGRASLRPPGDPRCSSPPVASTSCGASRCPSTRRRSSSCSRCSSSSGRVRWPRRDVFRLLCGPPRRPLGRYVGGDAGRRGDGCAPPPRVAGGCLPRPAPARGPGGVVGGLRRRDRLPRRALAVPRMPAMTVRWVRWAFQGTFGALGYWTPLAVGLALLALVGAGATGPGGRPGPSRRHRQARPRCGRPSIAMPSRSGCWWPHSPTRSLTARGRWWLGRSASTSSQNLHLLAVLTLPIIAAGAEACASRWRSAVLVAVALLLVPVPFNARGFRGGRTTPDYFAESRLSVLSTAVNPLSALAEPEHHPAWWEREMSFGMDVGFLLDAAADGRLDPLPGSTRSSRSAPTSSWRCGDCPPTPCRPSVRRSRPPRS